MGKRKNISNKTRFEVFKRDSFTCQYCGRSAPDVVLQVDHINPVAEGGENDIINYVTSCFECNNGKGKRKLSDQSTLAKQKLQLKELNEKRLQLEMMVKWKEELLNLNNKEVELLSNHFNQITGYSPNDYGEDCLKKWLKKYGFKQVMEAMDSATTNYLQYENGHYTEASVRKAFDYIGKVCNCKLLENDKPYIKDLFYIRGILRNRLAYCDLHKALSYLETAYQQGYSIEQLKSIALEVRNWTEFRDMMEDLTGVN